MPVLHGLQLPTQKDKHKHEEAGVHTSVSYLFSTVMTTSPSAASTLMPMGADSDPEGVSRSPSACLDNSAAITTYASPPDDVRLEARTMSWHTWRACVGVVDCCVWASCISGANYLVSRDSTLGC